MAASQTPRTTTMSTCTPETALGTHVLNIARYSLHKGIGVGKFIQSKSFTVGGYDWRVCYYPDGAVDQVSKEYISVCLELLTKNAEVRAVYDFSLAIPGLPATTDSRELVFSSKKPFVFNGVSPTRATPKFKKRSELEASRFLRDDGIVIVCDVTVIKETRVEETALAFEVPPSNLLDNFRDLLHDNEGQDVTFMVQGKAFPAHKLVLRMRSPFFEEKPPKWWKGKMIVKDMQPAVFEALLHFIYTDSLPSMDDLAGDKRKEMVRDLLVAAAGYKMERMKMMCEAILCNSLDVETVVTTFALADKHNCGQLKDACVKFINSSNRRDGIMKSQAYKDLEGSHPAVLIDLLKKVCLTK